MRVLGPLVGPLSRRPFGFCDQGAATQGPLTGAEWKELKEKVRALGGVHWDAEKQSYAAGARRRTLDPSRAKPRPLNPHRLEPRVPSHRPSQTLDP